MAENACGVHGPHKPHSWTVQTPNGTANMTCKGSST